MAWLARNTVLLYSTPPDPENAMHSHEFRLVYRPSPDRLPRWLHRVWAWF